MAGSIRMPTPLLWQPACAKPWPIRSACGKWGGLASRFFGRDALLNRRCLGIPASKVREYPWPWGAYALKAKLQRANGVDWLAANDWFDRWAAERLARGRSSVFVGVETCAQ